MGTNSSSYKRTRRPQRGKKGNSGLWEYFSDCQICHAMKQADKQGRELNEVELKEAFRKQNKG